MSGVGLSDIAVQAAGTPHHTVTDDHGDFTLELLPGAYELEFVSEYYRKQTLRVEVAGEQTVRLARPIVLGLNLPEAVLQTEVKVIREPDRNSTEAQNLIRKNSARISDGVSAEEIRKSADVSAAQTAARAVGATVVGDRFVYVRGLGERYANTLFNGAPLPSPEPDQQAVPFDIIPAHLLANLTLAKTATPDIPADFAGGSVQINTQEFPSRRTLHLSAGLGGNFQTLGQPMLTYPGGQLDWLGFDDGTRARPLQQPGQPLSDYGRAFPNIWSPRRLSSGLPNYSFSASLGDQVRIRDKKLGYLVSLTYSSAAQTREEEVQVLNLVDTGSGQELRSLIRFSSDPGAFAASTSSSGRYSVRSTYSTQWGALATLSMQPALWHRLTLTGIFTQSADRETRVYQGYSQDQQAELWNSRLRFIARTLGFLQLSGGHRLERLSMGASDLDWSLSYAAAARAEPDNREITYLKKDDGFFHFTPKGTSGQRFYSDNVEHQLAALLDYTQAFKQWRALPARFKLGAAARLRLRDFAAYRYKFGFGGLGDLDDRLPPEQLFLPEHIGQKLDFRENTNTADSYNARLGVYAAYALVDLPLSARLRLTTGLRFEAAQQRLWSRDPRQADAPITVALDTYDPLPSLNLLYQLTNEMNLRAAASMTVARPEFRELAPFQFADFYGGELVQGNPELQRTRVINADLRWEWFIGQADLVAVSAYYKYFDAPIETTINAGGNLIRSFANARSAYNLGGELEARKELSHRGKGLSGLTLGGNVALIYSRVDLTGVAGQQTSQERPLQGQSPFVVNLFVEFERPQWGTQLRLSYNVFGERIDQVGAFGLPDKFEQPRHQLDLTATQRLPRGLSLRLSARNLVNSPVHIVQRGSVPGNGAPREVAETTMRYTLGSTISLSLAYRK